jgi:hypothetical protein
VGGGAGLARCWVLRERALVVSVVSGRLPAPVVRVVVSGRFFGRTVLVLLLLPAPSGVVVGVVVGGRRRVWGRVPPVA